MNEYKTKLLNKYLNDENLNDFEQKKFNEYLDKTNVFTYCRYENETDVLNKEYIIWSELKIKKMNFELSKDKNIVKFLNK